MYTNKITTTSKQISTTGKIPTIPFPIIFRLSVNQHTATPLTDTATIYSIQDTARMQERYTNDTARIQERYRKDTGAIYKGYRKDTETIQKGYRNDTENLHLGIRRDHKGSEGITRDQKGSKK